MIDTQTLIDCTGATRANAERYVVHLADGMNRFRIHSDNAMACFLGQLSIESENLSKVEEDLYYTTPARLREIFFFGLSGRAATGCPGRRARARATLSPVTVCR